VYNFKAFHLSLGLWLTKQQLLWDLAIIRLPHIAHPAELICNMHPFNTDFLIIIPNLSPCHPFFLARVLPGFMEFELFPEVEDFSSKPNCIVLQEHTLPLLYRTFFFGF
jgi:hypothetical protein